MRRAADLCQRSGAGHSRAEVCKRAFTLTLTLALTLTLTLALTLTLT